MWSDRMKVIKQKEDIYTVKNPHHKHILLEFFREVMARIYTDGGTPEDNGWMVYFEKGDDLFSENADACMQKESDGIYHKWPSLGDIDMGHTGWEAVERYEDLYIVTVIMNNSFGMSYFIPDESWIDPILLRTLEDECIGNFKMEDIVDADRETKSI
jgi:hypothetical protein